MDSTSVKNAVIQQIRTEASVANAQKLMNVRTAAPETQLLYTLIMRNEATFLFY